MDETILIDTFGGLTNLFLTLLDVIQKTDSKKIVGDTGKLLSLDHRNWIKTSFLDSFQKLVKKRLNDHSLTIH